MPWVAAFPGASILPLLSAGALRRRSQRVCSCGRVAPDGKRCGGQIANSLNRRHEVRRPTSTKSGYDLAWREARAEFLASQPNCAMCRAPGTVLEHSITHTGDRVLFCSHTNWQSLCKSCCDQDKERQDTPTQSLGKIGSPRTSSLPLSSEV